MYNDVNNSVLKVQLILCIVLLSSSAWQRSRFCIFKELSRLINRSN